MLCFFEVHDDFLLAERLDSCPLAPDQMPFMLLPPTEELNVLGEPVKGHNLFSCGDAGR